MKKFLFIFTCLAWVCTHNVHSQQLSECEKIVNIAVDAVNNRSTDELKKYLASDFVCAQQTGTVAIMVMEQLITQLNEQITDINKLSEQQENGTLTLVYDFNYSKRLGHKNATFVFNTNNQLKQMDLLTVQVKRANVKADFRQPIQDSLVIPVEICNNLLVATAELNGIKRKFVIDSGAPTLYLNSKYFTENDTAHTSISTSKSVGSSSISGQDLIHVDSFDFHGIKIRDKDFVMSDLSHLLKDEEIYGLIGFRVIKDYDWLFDYEQKTLTLIHPDKTAEYLKQQANICEVQLQMVSNESHIPFAKGEVDGIEISLGIDCGASSNLLDASFWNDLKDCVTNASTTDLIGASKETLKTNIGNLKTLKIGNKLFEEVPTVFSDISHLNANRENKIDGLIGYEILSKQKTLICIRDKKMFFID